MNFEASTSLTSNGAINIVTRSGGITYNVRVGDRAIGWASDHTEPGVSVRNRDAEESAAGAMYLNSSDLEFVNDGFNSAGNQTVGMRFNAVTIPRGATITRAYVQLQVDETGSTATSLTIFLAFWNRGLSMPRGMACACSVL